MVRKITRRDFLHLSLATTAGMVLDACQPRSEKSTPAAAATTIGTKPVTSIESEYGWSVIGPGGGGAQFGPAISPHDPNKVFVSCDMTGSFVTEDGGGSWRMFNLRGVTKFFAFDLQQSETIYTYSIGLWRSLDGSKTWNLVYPDPSQVTGIVQVGDHAMETILTADGPAATMLALAVDPADSKILYAAMKTPGGIAGAIVGGGSTGGTEIISCSSNDWGKTWTFQDSLPAGCCKILVDPKSPKNDRTVYILGDNAVSVRRGGTWTHQAPPEHVNTFNSVSAAFSADGQLVVYGVSGPNWNGGDPSETGIFISKDGGANWQKVATDFLSAAKGSSQVELRAIAACASQPGVVYVSYKDVTSSLSDNDRMMGVVKSIDGGQTWSFVWKDTAVTEAGNIKDAWINDRFGPMWGENPFDLDVAPTNPNICYGTDFGRTMRTLDGGQTWEAVYSKSLTDRSWTTRGLDVTTCYSIHFDPFKPEKRFISFTDIGLFRSDNGGQGWFSATAEGVPANWINTCYWLEFDPAVEGLMWAVMSEVHDLPRPKMWRNRGVSNYRGGVVVSRDGGKSWKSSSGGLGQTAPTHILLDPASPVGSRTLYVCAFGKGVYKSVDDGKNWMRKNKGLAGSEPLAWHLERTPGGILYLVVARRSEDGSIGDEKDGAIYRSTDGAESWTKLPLPDGCNGPTSLLVDPQDENRLLLSAWGRKVVTSDEGGGIYLSADAGQTWTSVLTTDQHIHDLSFDPRNNTWYACGFESSAFRSSDGGQTWQRIRGFNFKWGRKVIPDPENVSKIYVATFGGSMWHGPAQGDSESVEDIVTPQVGFH